VGLFVSREAAESYRDNAIPPVTDGKITEWNISDVIVGPGGMLRATEILQSLGILSAYATHDGKDPDEVRATQDAWGET
jgi:hypothetical protein